MPLGERINIYVDDATRRTTRMSTWRSRRGCCRKKAPTFCGNILSDMVETDLLALKRRYQVRSAMPVAAYTSDWPNLHAAEVRKLATLLEISQALLAAREFQPGLTKVLDILGAH